MAGTGTGTKTSSNSFNTSRIDLICKQLEVLLGNLTNWKTDKICKLTYAIKHKYLNSVTLYAVDTVGNCYGAIKYSLDWEKHQSLLITDGNILSVKRKYEASLPETKALVEGMNDLMSEMNLHIDTYFNIVESHRVEFSRLFKTKPIEAPHLVGESANFNTKILSEVNASLCLNYEQTVECSVCGDLISESNCIRTDMVGDVVCSECVKLARQYDVCLTGRGKYICDLISNRRKVRTANIFVNISSSRFIRDKLCFLELRVLNGNEKYCPAVGPLITSVPHYGMNLEYTIPWQYPYTEIQALLSDSYGGTVFSRSVRKTLGNPDKNIEYPDISLFLGF